MTGLLIWQPIIQSMMGRFHSMFKVAAEPVRVVNNRQNPPVHLPLIRWLKPSPWSQVKLGTIRSPAIDWAPDSVTRELMRREVGSIGTLQPGTFHLKERTAKSEVLQTAST